MKEGENPLKIAVRKLKKKIYDKVGHEGKRMETKD